MSFIVGAIDGHASDIELPMASIGCVARREQVWTVKMTARTTARNVAASEVLEAIRQMLRARQLEAGITDDTTSNRRIKLQANPSLEAAKTVVVEV